MCNVQNYLNRIVKTTVIMVFLISFSISCYKEDEAGNSNVPLPDPLQPLPAITTTVAGVVIDENGKPLADAEIWIHGETTVTGPDGGFIFENIEVPGNRCVVESRKEGYFSGIRALTPKENRQTEVRIVMMGSPITHTFQASTGSNASLDNGSEVQIPANGLVSSTGDAYSGPVSMSVRYLDPTAGNFGVLVPGGDMLAQREDQSTSVLYSYGILRVQMTDLSGDQLQLAPGTESTLIMNIPADQLSTAPPTIPLWYFDEEKGVWQEEGSAKREGNRYIGTVTHFTDWNCDDPTEGATIIGRLIDCNDQPAWGIVEFGQIATDPQSSTESGQTDGRFERRVPDGVPLQVVITDPLMITPLTANERGKVIVMVPPLSPGQVYDVGDIKTFPCPSDVIGTFQTKPGDGVMYVSFSSDKGYKSLYNPGPNLQVNLPPNITVTMEVYTMSGIRVIQNVQTPGENETLDLGIIDLSSEVVAAGDAVITGKTLCYGEPETDGQISVYWNDGASNTGYNYTSPEADGTFSIQAPTNMSVLISSSTSNGTWTRTVQTAATPGEVTQMGTIELCDNALVGETSFRMTGDGFNNVLFAIVSNQNMDFTNMGIYYPTSNVTIGVAVSLTDEMNMSFFFPGNTTGVKANVEETSVMIVRESENRTVYYWGGTMPGSDLKLNVTRYDDVGGVIEGTFSGTFLMRDEGETFGDKKVTITDGKFSVLRYPDAF